MVVMEKKVNTHVTDSITFCRACVYIKYGSYTSIYSRALQPTVKYL